MLPFLLWRTTQLQPFDGTLTFFTAAKWSITFSVVFSLQFAWITGFTVGTAASPVICIVGTFGGLAVPPERASRAFAVSTGREPLRLAVGVIGTTAGSTGSIKGIPTRLPVGIKSTSRRFASYIESASLRLVSSIGRASLRPAVGTISRSLRFITRIKSASALFIVSVK